jgi:hypothetical protein
MGLPSFFSLKNHYGFIGFHTRCSVLAVLSPKKGVQNFFHPFSV